MSYEKLYQEISKFNCKRIVFTGGEPLLQQDKIIEFLQKYPEFIVEIETNGTVMPKELLLEKAQFNCSPKLTNSGNELKLRFYENVLREINKRNCLFKFVVKGKEDFDEIENSFILTEIVSRENVGVMPEGTNLKQNQEIMLKIVDSCKEHDFRLLPRLQNVIWGAKRRV